MRDRADNFVVIYTIENVYPMGVHTGDSITLAPAQTLTDRAFQHLRDLVKQIMCIVGVETGCLPLGVRRIYFGEQGQPVTVEIPPGSECISPLWALKWGRFFSEKPVIKWCLYEKNMLLSGYIY